MSTFANKFASARPKGISDLRSSGTVLALGLNSICEMENFEEQLHKDLHQFYLMGAAMQLKRMGYHMTKMN